MIESWHIIDRSYRIGSVHPIVESGAGLSSPMFWPARDPQIIPTIPRSRFASPRTDDILYIGIKEVLNRVQTGRMTIMRTLTPKQSAIANECLDRATSGQSTMNYGPIIMGFINKGIPVSQTDPIQ